MRAPLILTGAVAPEKASLAIPAHIETADSRDGQAGAASSAGAPRVGQDARPSSSDR